jgi:hypothetical protein
VPVDQSTPPRIFEVDLEGEVIERPTRNAGNSETTGRESASCRVSEFGQGWWKEFEHNSQTESLGQWAPN